MKTINLSILSSVCGGMSKWGAPTPLPGVLPPGQFLQLKGGSKKHPLDIKERVVDVFGKKIGKTHHIGDD